MFRENEYKEGRKDSKTDHLNKKKRDLSRYPSKDYQAGYRSYRPKKVKK